MGFISLNGLVELKKYQYKSGGYSWLDNKFNPFWLACLEMIPLYIAPNLLTFIGFCFMLASCIISVSYDHTLTQTIPSWTFLFSAFSIFVYQTLDAIDGKQARRTKSSSPLGQLFDHGCDSFSLTFFLLGIAQAAKIDKEYFFLIFLGNQVLLWGANQNEYYTGIMHTHFKNFGVTESELLCIFIHLISFTYGQDIWHLTLQDSIHSFVANQLPELLITTKFQTFIIIPLIISYFTIGLYIFVINLKISKNPMRVIFEWIPLIIFWWLCKEQYNDIFKEFIWFNSDIYGELAGPILILFGIVQSLIVSKVIICSTTKDIFPLFHLETIPFLVACFVLLLNPSNIIKINVFWLSLLLTVLLVIRFLNSVVSQITQFLNIYCFSLKQRN